MGHYIYIYICGYILRKQSIILYYIYMHISMIFLFHPIPVSPHPTPARHTQYMTKPEKLRHIPEANKENSQFEGIIIIAVGANKAKLKLSEREENIK